MKQIRVWYFVSKFLQQKKCIMYCVRNIKILVVTCMHTKLLLEKFMEYLDMGIVYSYLQ